MSNFLNQKNIGVSISGNNELASLGFDENHQKDCLLELSRHFLINGAQLVYGHDPRKDGYAQVFAELNRIYVRRATQGYKCVNYWAWPFSLKLELTDRLQLEEAGIQLEIGPCETSIQEDIALHVGDYFTADREVTPQALTKKAQSNWSLCLSQMRLQMNEQIHARIFMGGQRTSIEKVAMSNTSFEPLGTLHGILEEAILALKSNKPCYFIGAYGGITKMIYSKIDSVQNMHPTKLQMEYVDGNIDKYQDALNFLMDFDLKRLSVLNGLSLQENRRLAETCHVTEMVSLVLKGLSKALS